MTQQSFDFPAYRAARQQASIDAAPPAESYRNRQPPVTFDEMYTDVKKVYIFLSHMARGPFGTVVYEDMRDTLKDVAKRLRELGELGEIEED